jgi:hypothetical protein
LKGERLYEKEKNRQYTAEPLLDYICNIRARPDYLRGDYFFRQERDVIGQRGAARLIYAPELQGSFYGISVQELDHKLDCDIAWDDGAHVGFCHGRRIRVFRFDFIGRTATFKTILLIQIFPLTLSMVAIYKIVSMLGLINTQISLILVNTVMALPYSILLSKGYFDTIPKDLEESAYMDGASRARTLWSVIIPLVKPIIATIAISSFVLAYNEYVLANVLMSGGFESMPLAVGLRSMFAGQYGVNWPRFAAAASLGSSRC